LSISVLFVFTGKKVDSAGCATYTSPLLAYDLLKAYCPSKSNFVMDFFCGSGSFAAVSIMEGINYWGCDNDVTDVRKVVKSAAKHFEKKLKRMRDSYGMKF
jgi:ribosomal protein L11 methylase PrmA